MEIKSSIFKIIVKPNSKKSEIMGYDPELNLYRINVKAKPEGNKANIEVIKFLSKELKKKLVLKAVVEAGKN